MWTRQHLKVVKICSIDNMSSAPLDFADQFVAEFGEFLSLFFLQERKENHYHVRPYLNSMLSAASTRAHLLIQAFLQRLHPQLLPSQLHLQSGHLCLVLGPHLCDLPIGPEQ